MKDSALFDREKIDSFQLEVFHLQCYTFFHHYKTYTKMLAHVSLYLLSHTYQVSAVEAKQSLITKMKKTDKSHHPSNKIQITINVDDDNDNSPVFTPSKTLVKCIYICPNINR